MIDEYRTFVNPIGLNKKNYLMVYCINCNSFFYVLKDSEYFFRTCTPVCQSEYDKSNQKHKKRKKELWNIVMKIISKNRGDFQLIMEEIKLTKQYLTGELKVNV